jgi:hypothetical protein
MWAAIACVCYQLGGIHEYDQGYSDGWDDYMIEDGVYTCDIYDEA